MEHSVTVLFISAASPPPGSNHSHKPSAPSQCKYSRSRFVCYFLNQLYVFHKNIVNLNILLFFCLYWKQWLFFTWSEHCGMRWICLVEEGESDQYRSACSCSRSLNDAEVVMQVLGFTSLWVTVTAHKFLLKIESILKMEVFMKDMQVNLLSTRLKQDHAQMS